ncbi:heat-inducible transcriptional repressor HrcA [Fonticella tunisiensis]|uniref:Heat-inducible transcription repressor HrcA n=1 Tax=Fonticella tunisiensis TaxID=1096341 RepID=A0A4R7KCN5_9CLOT|nr:heat-inducible transcriptional repressor HrcA [Fonticella tunisiensis]TDT51109.1 heat-inducible transcription repressor HrcA [Fonticella tunisiensis]
MELGDRKKSILKAIITDYIETAEPVGSRTIAKKYEMGISSATIRNEMSDLEDLGYLEQPHTSSGRIPSDKGYRTYVNYLMQVNYPTNEEIELIKNYMKFATVYEVDKIIKRTIKLLSQITMYTSAVLTPSVNRSTVKSIQLIRVSARDVIAVVVTDTGIIKNVVIKLPKEVSTESIMRISNMLNSKLYGLTIEEIDLAVISSIQNEMRGYSEIFNAILPVIYDSLKANDCDVYLEGATNIFNYPEYDDRDKAYNFLSMIENKDVLIEALSSGDDNITITIGKENEIEEIKDCSIIKASYKVGGKTAGTIGVIGPTRMNYARVIGIIKCLTDILNDILKSP